MEHRTEDGISRHARSMVAVLGGTALLVLSLAVVLVASSWGGAGQPEAAAGSPVASGDPGQDADWILAFADEFTGPELDPEKWSTRFWWGRTNAGAEDLQYYVDDACELRDGLLRLKADARPNDRFAYTSGMIASHGKFAQRYGYFEIRARLPAGQGLWPAFWLLPDPASGVIWPPEIDVVELLGHDPRVAYMNYHYVGEDGEHAAVSPPPFIGPDFTAGFHTFALLWEPETLTWFVDGTARNRATVRTPDLPMYLLVNLAVGGWAGNPSASTAFPAYLEVDFVRVYQRVERTRASGVLPEGS